MYKFSGFGYFRICPPFRNRHQPARTSLCARIDLRSPRIDGGCACVSKGDEQSGLVEPHVRLNPLQLRSRNDASVVCRAGSSVLRALFSAICLHKRTARRAELFEQLGFCCISPESPINAAVGRFQPGSTAVGASADRGRVADGRGAAVTGGGAPVEARPKLRGGWLDWVE